GAAPARRALRADVADALLQPPRGPLVRRQARRRLIAAALSVATVAFGLGAWFVVSSADTTPGPAFEKDNVPLVRTHHNADAADPVAYQSNFSVAVDRNKTLRSGDLLTVIWPGAPPTLGRAANSNSAAGEFTEYPVVLMECRGDDTAGNAITPST